MIDKYGVEQDPDCYLGTSILINLLNIRDDNLLLAAERDLSAIAAANIDFFEPPYNLNSLQTIHRLLFADIYEWAGEIRLIDISKGGTRFCTATRIMAEASKLFGQLHQQDYFVNLPRQQLMTAIADFYIELNVIHPFREGNGRSQRIFFEHLIANCGFNLSWQHITQEAWINANIEGYLGNIKPMIAIFEACIGDSFLDPHHL